MSYQYIKTDLNKEYRKNDCKKNVFSTGTENWI